jgi:agmatine deiminase
VLGNHLDLDKVIWLGRGLDGDITGGHVDNLACFAAPGVVCLTWTDDRSDPLHAICTDAGERLERTSDARGRRLEVHRLPAPGPLAYTEEESSESAERRLSASYVNFYIANDSVIVPLLDSRTDDQALEILGALFGDRSVIGVPRREILLGGGKIQCITQQVPAAS